MISKLYKTTIQYKGNVAKKSNIYTRESVKGGLIAR